MTMELSRKRKKQIKKFKGQTATLLGEQRKVLAHANAVLAEARVNAADAARNDVAPRVKDAYANGIKPRIATSVQAASSAAGYTRDRVVGQVVPGLVSSLGSALSLVDLAKDPKIQKIVKKAATKAAAAQKKGGKAATTVAKNLPTQQRSGLGFGGVALIIVGVVALIGAGYAAYQTLRADDDLWVADDTDASDKPASSGTPAA